MKEKLKKAKGYVKEHAAEIASVTVMAICTGVCGVYMYTKGYKDGTFCLGKALILRDDQCGAEEKTECIKRIHKHIYGK